MNKKPLVTIMIPCYNQAADLPKAIESALAQTYSPLEIIVADDCSTDNSTSVVAKYLIDPRLRYIRNQLNIGRVENYHNLVYNLSHGEWLINLDGDDYWINESFIQTAMQQVENHPDLVLVFGRQKYYNLKLKELITKPPPKLDSLIDGKKLFLKYPSLHEGIPHMAAVYKKSVAISAHVFTNNIIYADSEAMLRILPFGTVAFINVFAGIWNNHGNNASYNPQITKRIENHMMITSPYEFFSKLHFFEQMDLLKWREQFLTRLIRETSYFYLDNYDLKSCFNYLKKSFSEIKFTSFLKILINPRFLIRLFFLKGKFQIIKIRRAS